MLSLSLCNWVGLMATPIPRAFRLLSFPGSSMGSFGVQLWDLSGRAGRDTNQEAHNCFWSLCGCHYTVQLPVYCAADVISCHENEFSHILGLSGKVHQASGSLVRLAAWYTSCSCVAEAISGTTQYEKFSYVLGQSG